MLPEIERATVRSGSAGLFSSHVAELDERGWMLLPAVVNPSAVAAMRDALDSAFAAAWADQGVRRRGQAVYAARNVLDVCPAAATMWRNDLLRGFLIHILGSACGLVRALFFDKPPDQSWALPWHKDLTIPIAGPSAPAEYSRPRLRAGVYHTEPPVEVLRNMLTLRIHLDPARTDNGALHVLTGSHRTDKRPAVGYRPEVIVAEAGDVLAMRPLVSHSSGCSQAQCHRRVLHLEFAASEQLPGAVQWHRFIGINPRYYS